MSKRLKAILQTGAIFAVTILLIWFSLGNLEAPASETGSPDKWDFLLRTWQNANKFWLLMMAVLAMISHVIRAQRWRMLFTPSGHRISLSNSFLSLMVGYLVNLVIPRGGEISRCYNLYKLEKTPVEISFGTVVVERLVDLVCLIILVALAFAVESNKLFQFVAELPIGTGQSRLKLLIYAALLLALFATVFYVVLKRSSRVRNSMTKIWNGFKEGILSIFKLEKKGLFLVYSVLIWLFYFVMSYTVIMAFPETDMLGVSAVLSLFAIGSIAMAVPLPGGMGSYHVLVPQGLVFLYGISNSNAVAFVFIFHGWQTAIMILGGAISLLITSIRMKKSVLVE